MQLRRGVARSLWVDGQKLFDLSIDLPSANRKKPTLQGPYLPRRAPRSKRASLIRRPPHGFLPLKESPRSTSPAPQADDEHPRAPVEGKEVIVQSEGGARTKGAALTTFISLAGRFLVPWPNNRAPAVSRAASRARTRQMPRS